jgi:hypothetical protein
VTDFTKKANLYAAEVLARYGTSDTYDRQLSLIALAYAQGARDELARVAADYEQTADEMFAGLVAALGDDAA